MENKVVFEERLLEFLDESSSLPIKRYIPQKWNHKNREKSINNPLEFDRLFWKKTQQQDEQESTPKKKNYFSRETVGVT